ncbi:MAG: hypothetical protein HC806_08990 [Anaerolineae bacterium]|nr:hypothetical protein [Anaerolineae bacterium]
MIGFVIMVYITINVAINGNEDAFGRAKDLLLFINPIVGIIIGYYFNKTTSDARAEKAEANVQAAAESAQIAVKERDKAVEKAQTAEAEIKVMRGALDEVWVAADEMLKDTQPAPVEETKETATRGGLEPLSAEQTIGPPPPPETVRKKMWELQQALKRAEKWK